MTDYTDLGLDSNLKPLSSPIATNEKARTDAYKFNSQFERNTVTSMNIKDFSFSSGKGGTLELGGTLNGNGQMIVYDSSGSARVNIDNAGIVVKNSSGVTTIDGQGVVSTTSFPSFGAIIPSDSVGNSVQTITTETTYTNITNGTTPGTTSVVLSRAAKIYISGRIDAYFYQSGTAGYGAFGRLAIDLGGTKVNEAFFSGDRVNGATGPTGYGFTVNSVPVDYVGQLAAGTTTIKLQAYKNSSAGTITSLEIVGYSLNYFVLGT